jgi:hypothetical protein
MALEAAGMMGLPSARIPFMAAGHSIRPLSQAEYMTATVLCLQLKNN